MKKTAAVLIAFAIILCMFSVPASGETNDGFDFHFTAECDFASENYTLKNCVFTVKPEFDCEPCEMSYTFRWSDGYDASEEFTPVAEVKRTDGEIFTLQLNDALAPPQDIRGIEIEAYGFPGGAETYSSVFVEFPAEMLAYSDAVPICKFSVLSDIHIRSSSESDLHSAHFIDAMNDIYSEAPDTSDIISVGDNVDSGSEKLWQYFINFRDSFLEGKNIEWHCAVGNHEVSFGNSSFYKYRKLFLEYTGNSEMYYSFERNGYLFIILGTESGSESLNANLSDEQLDWLRGELAESQKGQQIFLFIHQPLKDTTSGTLTYLNPSVQTWYGINREDELREILSDYPDAVMFCGHGHWHYDSPVPCLPGFGETPSFVNTASVAYLWNDENTEVKGSQGLFVEVYDKYTLIRGYDFVNNKWVGAASFRLLSSSQAEAYGNYLDSLQPHEEKTSGCGCVLTGASVAAVLPIICAAIILRKKEKKSC